MTEQESDGGEHRWRVYIVCLAPMFHEDWTTVRAESKADAVEKVAESVTRRTGDWRVDPSHEPEMIL